jgi:hypothetical protein
MMLRRLLKERYAEQVQCVTRYKPNRDGNHHANKRNSSNLNNDRCVSLIAFHGVHCGVSARERGGGGGRYCLAHPPRFKLCAESHRMQVSFLPTEYVAYLVAVASRARSPRRRYDSLLGELFTSHVTAS